MILARTVWVEPCSCPGATDVWGSEYVGAFRHWVDVGILYVGLGAGWSESWTAPRTEILPSPRDEVDSAGPGRACAAAGLPLVGFELAAARFRNVFFLLAKGLLEAWLVSEVKNFVTYRGTFIYL